MEINSTGSGHVAIKKILCLHSSYVINNDAVLWVYGKIIAVHLQNEVELEKDCVKCCCVNVPH